MNKYQRALVKQCLSVKMNEVKRTFWNVTKVKDDYHGDYEIRTIEPEATAKLVSSKLENGLHAPTLDIDMPAKLIPSSNLNHYHLYIDHPMTWRKYKKLLRALYRAGLIEKGFYKLSKQRKATFLRKPGVYKSQVGLSTY